MYLPDSPDRPIIRGTAIKLPDFVRAGMIVSIGCRGSYNRDEFKDKCFDNLDPNLKGRIAPGDIIVAGRDFARGETGEETTMALTGLKVGALIAVSVNRIFLRNSINLGFPVVIWPKAVEMIEDGDRIEIDPVEAIIRNMTRGLASKGKPLPEAFRKILESGGIVNHVKMETEKKKTKNQSEK